MFEKSSSKNMRYFIEDNFFTFWFRFIYKYNYMIEVEAYSQLRTIIERDYETFTGITLERYFRSKLIEAHDITRMGNWWDRKGENEIDIITENELTDTATFYEVKRQKANIDMEALKEKSGHFLKATGKFNKYHIIHQGLSMEDM